MAVQCCDVCQSIYNVESCVYGTQNVSYSLCPTCYKKYSILCAHCKKLYIYYNAPEFRKNNKIFLCDRCREILHKKIIKRYNYKPRSSLKFLDVDNKGNIVIYSKKDKRFIPYFGIELEIEIPSSQISLCTGVEILEELDFVYLKHDGTLHNGFEIVTFPLSWKWILHNKDKFNPIFNLSKRGILSYDKDTCGMHIHISKDVFSEKQLFNFMWFIYSNRHFIYKLSQRTYRSLNEFASLTDISDEQIQRYSRRKSGNFNKHQAVNLRNSTTVELRIARGTLNPRSFWKNVEFAKCLFDFSNILQENDKRYNKNSLDKFLSYVRNNRRKFPNLHSFMKEKEMYML